jgi:hypothetical protein
VTVPPASPKSGGIQGTSRAVPVDSVAAKKKAAPKPQEPAKPKTTKERIQALLNAYAETLNIVQACKRAKVDRKTHYRWLKKFPRYAAVFKESRLAAGDYLESEAADRASKGWLEPIYYQGEICGHVRRFDGGLLQFLLRGLKPDVYGVQRQEISGPQGTPMQAKIEVVFVRPGDTSSDRQ